jgi:WhiB family redox-sensing transcriptional regulator
VAAIAAAKAVCEDCAARAACLEFAVSTNQEYGIWGGMSEEERRDVRRARRVARRLRQAS